MTGKDIPSSTNHMTHMTMEKHHFSSGDTSSNGCVISIFMLVFGDVFKMLLDEFIPKHSMMHGLFHQYLVSSG